MATKRQEPPRPIDEFRPYLMLLARSQLGRGLQKRLDASDVVQNTLLNAHKNIGQFRGTSSAQLAEWLRRILARCIYEAGRRHGIGMRDYRKEQDILSQLEDSSGRLAGFGTADDTTPSAAALRAEQFARLEAALDTLPEDQRVVIELRYFGGLEFGEIAKQLDRTYASVVGLQRRGLEQLRKQLGQRVD